MGLMVPDVVRHPSSRSHVLSHWLQQKADLAVQSGSNHADSPCPPDAVTEHGYGRAGPPRKAHADDFARPADKFVGSALAEGIDCKVASNAAKIRVWAVVNVPNVRQEPPAFRQRWRVAFPLAA